MRSKYLAAASLFVGAVLLGVSLVPAQAMADGMLSDLALTEAGRLYAVGGSTSGSPRASYVVDSSVPGAMLATRFAPRHARGNTVIPTSSGVVVAGSISSNSSFYYNDALAYRLNADGTQDLGFGDGKVVIGTDNSESDEFLAGAATNDGGVILAGLTKRAHPPSFSANLDGWLVKLRRDGSLDPSFGSDGKVQLDTSTNSDEEFFDVLIDAEGRYLVAGVYRPPFVSHEMLLLARYDRSGALDTSFGTDGKLLTGIELSTAYNTSGRSTPRLLFQGNRIVVAASDWVGPNQAAVMAVRRYLDDGALDPTFGTAGRVVIDYGVPFQWARGIAATPDGNGLVVVGTVDLSDRSVGIAKLNYDGSFDTSFGTNGKRTDFLERWLYGTHYTTDYFSASDVVIQGDRIIVGGTQGVSTALALGAYDLDTGDRDNTFGTLPAGAPAGSPTYFKLYPFTGITPVDGNQVAAPNDPSVISPIGTAGYPEVSFNFVSQNASFFKLWVDGSLVSDHISVLDLPYVMDIPTVGTHTYQVQAFNNTTGTGSGIVSGSFVSTGTLAARFRPILAFDTSELWRPISVPTLLNETFDFQDPDDTYNHRICSSVGSCSGITSPAALGSTGVGQPKSNWPNLDLYGTEDGGEDAIGLDSNCSGGHTNGLYDCDDGPGSVIYWHQVGPFVDHPYQYIDYWFLYRYNKFTSPDILVDTDHEFDWEGMSVAYPAGETDPSTFTFAAIASHEGTWRYLRSALRCGDDETSCGDATSPVGGNRIMAYPANGSHATYPRRCSAPLGIFSCDQTGPDGEDPDPTHREKGHDGERPWANNDVAAALIAFPAATPWTIAGGNWTNWPGFWGAERHIDSPGNQERYTRPDLAGKCTERYTDDETDQCPDGYESTASRSAVGGPVASSEPASGAEDCASWAGPGVEVAVCDPDALRAAVRNGQLDNVAPVAATTTDDDALVAAAPGITQVVGDGLESDEVVSLSQAVPVEAEVTVRYSDAGKAYQAEFHGVNGKQVRGARITFANRNGRKVPQISSSTGAQIERADEVHEVS